MGELPETSVIFDNFGNSRMSESATVPAIPDIKVDIIDVNAAGEYSFPDSSKSLLASLQAHKKAVLISVPGAFTPTCSEKHLPGFIEHFDALSAKGEA